MKLDNEVINVIANSVVEGNKLFLPNVQLDRKLYVKVDKALKAIGGKWNRSSKAHLFDKDIEEAIEQLLQTGEVIDVKKEFQFFETPESLALEMVQIANIQENETVLEPSAGKGRISQHINGCDVIELNPDNRKYLISKGFNYIHDDFMTFDKQYDVIVANPPFSKQQDIDHITRMIELANRCVVSIASASVLFRDNKKTVAFRDLIESLGGTITELPKETFKESGTMVNVCLVHVEK